MKRFKKLGYMLLLLALVVPTISLPSAAYDTGTPSSSAMAQKESKVLIQNVRIFDGQNEKLSEGMSVLVEGNKISKIAKSIPAPAGAKVIDAKGKVLMPGLIDAHWHTMFNFSSVSNTLGSSIGYLSIAAAKASGDTLMRGFTTVRDVGGNSFGVKRAIDEGLAVGPRIYPSGGYIGQTAGHGDFRGPNDVPVNPGDALDYQQRVGETLIADGV
ncbi:MAG: amidohydrolase family protein, partial [Candidatus Deferrimicrobiaceae bacterium]